MRSDLRDAHATRPVLGPGAALHPRWVVASRLTATLLLIPAGLAAQERVAGACPDGTEPAELRGTPTCLREVGFPSGDLTLAGQWFTPRGEGPFPAVVVIRGSGESRRGNAWTESLARVLVDEGVGVLLPDKRGSGASEGDWRTADFHDLAGDALAGVRFLADRPEVIPERIGVMGLSQGGQVAPITAARSDSVAFVIDVVGAAVPFIENVRYEMLQTFREEGLSGARLEAAMELVDTAAGYVRGEVSWEAYEEALDGKRDVLGEAIADAYFVPTPDHWRWDFFRRMADFDPLEWWREVRQPTLVLLGGADRNTPTAETARRLEATFEAIEHPNWTVRVFEGLGHALWDTSGPMGEHGLDAEVRRTLVSWVRRVVAPDRPGRMVRGVHRR